MAGIVNYSVNLHESYQLLRRDPKTRPCTLQEAGRFWSARVGLHYRAAVLKKLDRNHDSYLTADELVPFEMPPMRS